MLVGRTPSSLEMWGGVECTVNRVGDTYFDQLARSGHRDRMRKDLELFAGLGLRKLRTALLWETFAAKGSWDHADLVLAEMDRLDLQPIAGLVHHGSGPPSTHLLDPEFPTKLAAYALQVAHRYPHIVEYTPVNEPQTTSRFSCLYGYWYPQHRTTQCYVRALYHQLKGIVLSMQAIRTVQPGASFVHTEDAGETFATPELERYRIEREHRRWLGTDLLCGLVQRDHALFSFLLENGLTEEEVFWFAENACPPSILGLNYYVTSDRFLDHRLELYPWPGGGDTGDEPLVDAEAVRVRTEGIAGARSMLRQAWDRYRLPLAITEAHLGCGELEQARWLTEIWHDARLAQADGIDVRAVTAWSLLGSFNWSNLCTRDTGEYEPGVFRLVDGQPRETLLTEIIRALVRGEPVPNDCKQQGWWRRPDRFTVPAPEGELASR